MSQSCHSDCVSYCSSSCVCDTSQLRCSFPMGVICVSEVVVLFNFRILIWIPYGRLLSRLDNPWPHVTAKNEMLKRLANATVVCTSNSVATSITTLYSGDTRGDEQRTWRSFQRRCHGNVTMSSFDSCGLNVDSASFKLSG
jgi:hypothetical protein